MDPPPQPQPQQAAAVAAAANFEHQQQQQQQEALQDQHQGQDQAKQQQQQNNILHYDATAHPIRAVTVFQVDRAEVTRLLSVRLDRGQNRVDVARLPSCLDPRSIRVDGVGTNAVVFDVIYTPPPAASTSDDDDDDSDTDVTADPARARRRELRGLRAELAELEGERAALDRQQSVLDSYGSTVSASTSDASGLCGFLDAYQARAAAHRRSLADVAARIVRVRRRIRKAEASAHEGVAAARRGATVTVVVLAEEEGDAELRLTYAVTGAGWTPMYDVRAHVDGGGGGGGVDLEGGEGDASAVAAASAAAGRSATSVTEKEKEKQLPQKPAQHRVVLQYRASLSQSTGESWDAVELTLSTAAPQLGADVPALPPVTLRERVAMQNFYSAHRSMARKKSMGLGRSLRSADSLLRTIDDYEGDDDDDRGAVSVELASAFLTAPQRLRTNSARVSERGVATVFAIEGLSTIPSGGDGGSGGGEDSQTHKVSIAELVLDNVDLEWVTVPKKQPTVFLQCKVKNDSDYPLLPGETSIFFGNSFVAKSYLPHVSAGESFTTSLGADASVRVTYHPQLKKHKPATATGGAALLFTPSGSSARSATTLFTQRITVQNARRTALSRLVVRDQVPVSADARIKVAVAEPRELPVGPGSFVGVAVREGVRARYAQKSEEAPADGEKGDGTVEWVCAPVAAGAAFDLNLVWEVSVPHGLRWEEF